MSRLVQQLLGTAPRVVEPDPSSPVLAWIQHECRHGKFARNFRQFAELHTDEDLDYTAVTVVSISRAGLVECRIPSAAFDHESRSPVCTDVTATLNPQTRELRRGGHARRLRLDQTHGLPAACRRAFR